MIGAGSPTDLKRDIEGAEPEALDGARALILRARPRLAVCAYHRCDHLWSIAEWISALDAGYSLHLRISASRTPDADAGYVRTTVPAGSRRRYREQAQHAALA